MIIVAIVVIYIYREDVAKASGGLLIGEIQKMAVTDPAPGVDTVKFNAVCDGLREKIESEPLDAEKFANMLGQMKTIPGDEIVDSVEAEMFYEAVFQSYPDLRDLVPAAPEMDSLYIEETQETGQTDQ